MRIYLDNIIFFLQKSGGISVYWYELERRALATHDDLTVVEPGDRHNNIFRKQLNIPEEVIVSESRLWQKWLRYSALSITLPERAIVHSSYYRISTRRNAVNIVTVHDFTYERFRSGPAKWIHTLQKRRAIRYADGIICISENTKRDLLKFFPDMQGKKIKVIYNGVSDLFRPGTGTDLSAGDPPYILYVGDRKAPYKNFAIAVDVLNRLKGYHLFIVGSVLSQEETSLLSDRLGGRYRHYANISSEALNDLYSRAFCLLYPSSYEGFGIPVVEAMKAGCPVVAANRSSIPEVAGEAALLVDSIVPESFLEAIRLLEEDETRKACIAKGITQAEKFSWDQCFQETMAFYNDVFWGELQ